MQKAKLLPTAVQLTPSIRSIFQPLRPHPLKILCRPPDLLPLLAAAILLTLCLPSESSFNRRLLLLHHHKLVILFIAVKASSCDRGSTLGVHSKV
eukprot:scaffold1308_cov93-Cylindrotheca_fusiformis.AAC.3